MVAMSLAHQRGDLNAIRELLNRVPALERREPSGGTWLHRSAELGIIPVIEFWLERGCDVNCNVPKYSKADGLATPLHEARNAKTTRYLISRGATVNTWTRYGGTPLHNAVVRNDPEQVRELLAAGARSSICDRDGHTPLALAMKLKRPEATKVLRDADAPETGKIPNTATTKPPRIDLRRDAKRIASSLKAAIKKYTRENSPTPVRVLSLAVSGIEGYVMIAFDSTGVHNPWSASHTEFAMAEFEKWRYAYELAEKGVRITTTQGRALNWRVSASDAEFEKPFFLACVAVLKGAQRTDAFRALPRAADFVIGVEATLGSDSKFWRVNS